MNAKLSPEQRAEIRARCELGESLESIAHDYRVTAMTICRIRKQLRAEALEREGIELGVLVKPKQPAEPADEQAEPQPRPVRVIRPKEAEDFGSDVAICKNVIRELHFAFRTAGRERDHRTQIDAAKAIAAVVRARNQIAPPKLGKGQVKTYTVEASPESWPPPPKDGSNGETEQRGECEGQAASAAHENRNAAKADDMASQLATAGTSSDPDRAGNAATAQV